MYVPKIFQAPSATAIRNYIDRNGFGTLVGTQQGDIVATHIPMMLEKSGEHEFLSGHISVANPQKNCFNNNEKMLAIFMEHHSYVSSSWYDHVNVPTWNYIAVHVYGTVEVLEHDAKLKSVESLVEKYEEDSAEAFRLTHMSERDLNAQLRGIVAFRLNITGVEAAWKLSQNRNERDYHEIIHQLRLRGDDLSLAIASEMESGR